MAEISTSCFTLSLVSLLIEDCQSALEMIASSVQPGMITETMYTTTQVSMKFGIKESMLIDDLNKRKTCDFQMAPSKMKHLFMSSTGSTGQHGVNADVS
uniref:AlNc14C3G470 protein n=1 Tax=Albugo laibachii Nc14 TaxID=890382 RepID=F0VZZ2_9STRA|nr:AlNc14C3G470 [Albugo laibachii Nc14]|eukprot:CCA14363.1 AlNc14C3G470 [Albugo laibachii Nc14]